MGIKARLLNFTNSGKSWSPLARGFLGLWLIVILFQIEFYPFSNYQMYSRAFLPGDSYRYFKIMQVSNDGHEKPFVNRKYGLFHAQAPLVESIFRHVRNGKSLKELGESLLIYVNQKDASIVRLNFYEVEYDWAKYKLEKIEGHRMPEAVKMKLIESVSL